MRDGDETFRYPGLLQNIGDKFARPGVQLAARDAELAVVDFDQHFCVRWRHEAGKNGEDPHEYDCCGKYQKPPHVQVWKVSLMQTAAQ